MAGNDKTVKDEVNLVDIYHALDNIVPPGEPWTFGEFKKLPVVPGLHVNGIGAIPLPMTSFTAEELKSVSCQDTADKSVCHTIQVRGDQVTLKNPAWNSALGELTWKIAKVLGVNQSLVYPRLHKLLVYQEGSVLETHPATAEEEKGVFGKLMIQLPSVYTGATYVLSHRGARVWTRSMDMPDQAPYGCHYIAHYADCQHEIPAIQSGHLLVLEYSLCYCGRDIAKPNLNSYNDGHIVSLLQRLPKSKTLFVVPLDDPAQPCRHEASRLRGPNRKFVHNAISRAGGWEIAFAILKKRNGKNNGEPYFYGWFDQGGKYAFSTKSWMDEPLNLSLVEDGGMVLSSRESFEKKWQVIEGATDPNSTGNVHAPTETQYYTYVIIAFKPRDSFERLCHYKFRSAIRRIENNLNRLSMAIDYLRQEKLRLSHRSFSELRKVVQAIHGENGVYWGILGFLFQRLTILSVPPEDVRAFIGATIKQHGQLDKTKEIHSYLERLSNNEQNQSPDIFSDKAKFFQSLYDETGWFNVAKEQELEKKLLLATEDGRPVFSWRMPDAKTTSPELNSFLHGNEEGPAEIVVGGGINNARQLCGMIEDRTTDCLVDGYSAKISNTGKFGAKASLMVHKTKQFFQAQIERYEENMKILRDVQTKLRKHRQPQQPDQQVAPKRVRIQVEGFVIDC